MNWKLTPKEAIELQKKMRGDVKIVPLKKTPRTISGADVSMSLFAKDGYAGFVTLSYPSLEIIDESIVKQPIEFPYIPGLLSFREIPMLLIAWEKLKTKPDVLIVDGIGIAHPRRLGIASHLGVILGIPTVGCAKSVLTGVYDEPEDVPGSVSYLYDKWDKKEIIGAALRTKKGVKPVFISPGHLITLEESIKLLKSCVHKHRLPEPTRFAHLAVNRYRIEGEKQIRS
ncbi:MAG: deoxyribonuclease V [Patescibacteria group bacterium]